MVAVIVIVVVVLLVLLVFWLGYNGLVNKRVETESAWAQIDVQLKRRYDLIPNLVETVKGYAAHERGTFDSVTQARANAINAQGPAQQAQAENALTGALKSLFAVAEAYPDLKANQNFMDLQQELKCSAKSIDAGCTRRPVLEALGVLTPRQIARRIVLPAAHAHPADSRGSDFVKPFSPQEEQA